MTAAGNPKHAMCLDAAHGTAGQLAYTNYCVYPVNPIGQRWDWSTTGQPGRLTLRSSGTCASAQDRRVTMAACNSDVSGAARVWTFPKSAPLPPPPPPAPPPGTCHGCQVDCCAVPRKWELPAQQQETGLEVLWGEQSFRGYQSGQHTVFSGTYIITVLYCAYTWLILQFVRAVWTDW